MKKEKIIISSALGDFSFNGYITETPEEASRGLSNIDKIGKFDCMVFSVNKNETAMFHTTKMKFNIDILELNEDQEITKIHHNVPPGIAAIPIVGASFVIEMNGELCKKYGIEEGDKVFTDDVDHRITFGEHSFSEIHKTAEFEGIDSESPDYDNNLIYVDKVLREMPSYREAARKSIIDNLIRSHEEFDIHSNEPEPKSTN